MEAEIDAIGGGGAQASNGDDTCEPGTDMERIRDGADKGRQGSTSTATRSGRDHRGTPSHGSRGVRRRIAVRPIWLRLFET